METDDPSQWAGRSAIASAYVLQNLALRELSGTEVALVLLLQVPLGPLAVFVGIGVAPGPYTVAGGALLLGVLALHEVAGMRAEVSTRPSLL